MGWCSIAMNRVFSTIQMVMARSTKGSMTIKFTISFSLIQYGWHSQIKNVLANLYQQGGHFLWDSSSSTVTKENSNGAQSFSLTLLDLTLSMAEKLSDLAYAEPLSRLPPCTMIHHSCSKVTFCLIFTQRSKWRTPGHVATEFLSKEAYNHGRSPGQTQESQGMPLYPAPLWYLR